MGLEIESRPSDSPYIERVWRSSSSQVTRMMSIASAHWDLVFWRHHGRVRVAVQGPESKAGPARVPDDATFFGIVFALGTSLSHLPADRLVDRSAEISDATRRSFRLGGAAWDLPDYDNAEDFVRRMARGGVLVRDPVVTAALGGARADVSERTLQRRFVAATGLTCGAIRQISRARQAAVLLLEGLPAHEVVYRFGYFDQPHLARSLSRYIGRTATQLRDQGPAEPLSLLYKTRVLLPSSLRSCAR